jgi:hypothetical protein
MSGAAKKEAQKKDLSYHYWHGRGGGDAPLATPQKLTPDELAALSLQPKPAGVAASAWNAARRGWHWRCLRLALAPALRKSAALLTACACGCCYVAGGHVGGAELDLLGADAPDGAPCTARLLDCADRCSPAGERASR